jgi:hypothetical protein
MVTKTDLRMLAGAVVTGGSISGNGVLTLTFSDGTSKQLAGAIGSAGTDGATGATGATGPMGPMGPQGPKGDTGAQGPQGPAGTAFTMEAVSVSGDSGYTKFPNGFILQWGRNTATNLTNTLIPFPTVFPNKCFGVQNTLITYGSNVGADNNDVVKDVNTANFIMRTDNNNGGYWFAYGY